MQRHLRHSAYLRHLQGWELGLVAMAIAGLGVLLAVPIAVPPDDIPLPVVDGRALSATLQQDEQSASALERALVLEIERPGEPAELYDLRALGTSLRNYGRAEARGDTYETVRARQTLKEDVSRARALGDEQLLALRAYQCRQFARELHRYEDTANLSDELIGLAGPFVALMSRYGWIDGRVVQLDEALRSVFCKRRWDEITGLTASPFALSVDEQRAFYAFVLQHPVLENVPSNRKIADHAREEWRLRKVEELARLDPAYPAPLSRGLLLLRLERYPEAIDALRSYVSAEDPPYALRARNYLALALSHEEPR